MKFTFEMRQGVGLGVWYQMFRIYALGYSKYKIERGGMWPEIQHYTTIKRTTK